jgi:Do/DeqQ family serine protease
MKNTTLLRNLISIVFLLYLFSCGAQMDQQENGSSGHELSLFEKKQSGARKSSSENVIPVSVAVPENLDFTYAASQAMPGVVHIRSTIRAEAPGGGRFLLPEPFRDFFGDEFHTPQPSPKQAAGSGVIISDDGYIVTNNHVVDNAEKIEITLFDNRSYEASVIGTDPTTDLALIKVDEDDLDFIEFGDSDAIEVGNWVLAVGNPFNLASTVTAGIISAKARNINILRERSAIESFIQTDAAVNRGNSGGALVDVNGKLIGINTAIATPTGTYAGYAFAVPVDIVKKVVDDLLNYGIVQRAYLGVYIRDVNAQLADEYDLDLSQGVFIDSIIPNSAAELANIKEEDVIVKIEDKNISSVPELQEIIGRQRPGDEIEITVVRNGNRKEITAELQNQQGSTAVVEKQEGKLMSKLGIEVVNLKDEEKAKYDLDGGVKVTTIIPGQISKRTDMREGFIITKVDKKPVKSVEQFIDVLKSKAGGVLVEGIYPGTDGTFFYAFGL